MEGQRGVNHGTRGLSRTCAAEGAGMTPTVRKKKRRREKVGFHFPTSVSHEWVSHSPPTAQAFARAAARLLPSGEKKSVRRRPLIVEGSHGPKLAATMCGICRIDGSLNTDFDLLTYQKLSFTPSTEAIRPNIAGTIHTERFDIRFQFSIFQR